MNITKQVQRINRENLGKGAWRLYKSAYQSLLMPHASDQKLLFIFGSQRSGTTLMTRLFARDIETKVYAEYSDLSMRVNGTPGLRLRPLEEISRDLDKVKAPLVVLKPLVETQNAVDILDFFPGSKALWMYRHYQDVAVSKLKKSGMHNGIRDMQFILEQRNSWRAEKVPEHIREMISQFYSPDMNPYDAAALYWYVRNNFLYEQKLDKSPSLMMCKYEDFVIDPHSAMREIYRFVERPFPENNATERVHRSSVGKGSDTPLSPAIVSVCEKMLTRLNATYEEQSQIAQLST